jgi:hypothetical protein
MNRYQHGEAKRLIHGYMVPRPPGTLLSNREQEFDHAKAELISNLVAQLGRIELFTYADFTKKVA